MFYFIFTWESYFKPWEIVFYLSTNSRHVWFYITGFSINLLNFYIPKGKKHNVSLQRASLAHLDNDFSQDLVGFTYTQAHTHTYTQYQVE